jgi:aminopeptidase N
VIQGGDGGMEYPMATLITGHRSLRSLVGVTVHELVHSWYQGVLANNESLYPWMDEGFTEFVAKEVVNYLFEESVNPNPQLSHFNAYFNLVRSNKEEPLSTHADHFNLNAASGVAAYSKGAVFLRQLIYIIGEENFKSGMLRYFDEWKFKHPEPNDFKRVMEKESGLILSWYFEQWINTTKTIDYGIKSVDEASGKTTIVLERPGDMIMPIDIQINLTSGSERTINIPLRVMRGHKPLGSMKLAEPWPWTYPTYNLVLDIPIDQIKSIEIDPDQQMADVNRDNNYYNLPKKKEQGG